MRISRALSALVAAGIAATTSLLAVPVASAAELPSGDPIMDGGWKRSGAGNITVVFGVTGTGTSGQLPSYCSSTAPQPIFTGTEFQASQSTPNERRYYAQYDSSFCSRPGTGYTTVELVLNIDNRTMTQKDFSGNVMFTWSWDKQEHCGEASQTWRLNASDDQHTGAADLADVTIKYPVCWVTGEYVRAARRPFVEITQKLGYFVYEHTDAADLDPDPTQKSFNSTRAWSDLKFTDTFNGVNSVSIGGSVKDFGADFGISWQGSDNVVQRQIYLSVDTRGCFVWGQTGGPGQGPWESNPNAKECLPTT